MNARDVRGFLTTNNIVAVCDESPELIFEEIQSLIDARELDIPDEAASIQNIELLMKLQAYYANQYPYLVGLWGALRHAATRTDAQRIGMRDYLEKAVSACSKKYDAASRMLTGFQMVQAEAKGWRTI